jgi:cardiolipin synthase
MMSKKAKLLLPTEYVRDATEEIKKATSQVTVVSLMVTDDTATDELIDALIEAAKRGVKVMVAADVFSYSELNGGFFPIRYYSKKTQSTNRMVKELERSGADFHWFGQLNTTLFNGRTHIKWCIVDDIVYSFGGVNLYKKGIMSNDYMFKLENRDLAAQLVHEHSRMVDADKNHYSYPSHSFKYGDDTVLIDGGFFGDSIIYRRACALAKEATKVLFVSQYCPTGKLNKLLKETESELYFNPWRHAHSLSRPLIRLSMYFSGQKTHYHYTKYLHAKFMIFEMADGREVALTGSHNFVHGGVILGTREIALETEDPSIIRQLRAFWRDNLV